MATEKRLIDANALVEKFCDRKDLFLNKMGGFQALLQREKGRVFELDNCIADVINAPTVDAVEVVHGWWEFSHTTAVEKFDVVKCSNCGHEAFAIAIYVQEGHYCPNCGAKMDGERKDNE